MHTGVSSLFGAYVCNSLQLIQTADQPTKKKKNTAHTHKLCFYRYRRILYYYVVGNVQLIVNTTILQSKQQTNGIKYSQKRTFNYVDGHGNIVYDFQFERQRTYTLSCQFDWPHRFILTERRDYSQDAKACTYTHTSSYRNNKALLVQGTVILRIRISPRRKAIVSWYYACRNDYYLNVVHKNLLGIRIVVRSMLKHSNNIQF